MTKPNSAFSSHLRFFLDFINHKFAWVFPNYQTTFQLLRHLLPFPFYTNQLYPLKLSFFSPLPSDSSFNLDPNLAPLNQTLLIDHFAGNPAHLDHVLSLKPFLIEDISLSLGSKWQNQNLGSFGLITLFQLGKNLDLFTQPPTLKTLDFSLNLLKLDSTPVILTTKRFQLFHQINLYLKNHPIPPPPLSLLPLFKKIGHYIQNYPYTLNLNQLTIRRLYRQHKSLSLPNIYPQALPFFTFLPYKKT